MRCLSSKREIIKEIPWESRYASTPCSVGFLKVSLVLNNDQDYAIWQPSFWVWVSRTSGTTTMVQ